MWWGDNMEFMLYSFSLKHVQNAADPLPVGNTRYRKIVHLVRSDQSEKTPWQNSPGKILDLEWRPSQSMFYTVCLAGCFLTNQSTSLSAWSLHHTCNGLSVYWMLMHLFLWLTDNGKQRFHFVAQLAETDVILPADSWLEVFHEIKQHREKLHVSINRFIILMRKRHHLTTVPSFGIMFPNPQWALLGRKMGDISYMGFKKNLSGSNLHVLHGFILFLKCTTISFWQQSMHPPFWLFSGCPDIAHLMSFPWESLPVWCHF